MVLKGSDCLELDVNGLPLGSDPRTLNMWVKRSNKSINKSKKIEVLVQWGDASDEKAFGVFFVNGNIATSFFANDLGVLPKI